MKDKYVVVGGSEGLIGKPIVEYLKSKKYGVIEADPKKENIDISCCLTINKLFATHNIVGFVNCAYPRNFQEHCEVYMNANFNFSLYFGIKNGGSIVNFASIYGILGPDDRIYKGTNIYMPDWYAAAKGAIIAHSRCMATRYANKNVRINCIALGGVYDNQSNEFVEKYNNRVPLGRMATSDDINPLVEFLISEKSKYITGQCIPLDGGISAW